MEGMTARGMQANAVTTERVDGNILEQRVVWITGSDRHMVASKPMPGFEIFAMHPVCRLRHQFESH